MGRGWGPVSKLYFLIFMLSQFKLHMYASMRNVQIIEFVTGYKIILIYFPSNAENWIIRGIHIIKIGDFLPLPPPSSHVRPPFFTMYRKLTGNVTTIHVAFTSIALHILLTLP